MTSLLPPGWIQPNSLVLHREAMREFPAGSVILENGSNCGRLFAYLHNYYPDWEYHGNDIFWAEEWATRSKFANTEIMPPVFASDNGLTIQNDKVKQNFNNNCPYAYMHSSSFVDIKDKTFDIISMGLASSSVNWLENYEHACTLLKPGGFIIARNLIHPDYKEEIYQAIKKCNLKSIRSESSGCAILTK